MAIVGRTGGGAAPERLEAFQSPRPRLSTTGGNEDLAIADTYLEDGLGSVSAVLREGGAVAASLSYSPWGEEELSMESLPGYGDRFERPHYGYNAELTSPEGGLQYLRARWYDPSMGAFGSRDPYLGDAADPATLNRYAYAEGNPVASCDPTGHESRVKYGGANANRIRRLASNPRRGAGASTGTWMSRNYTQKALSSKKPGLLTTRRVSNPVLASGGKRRAAVQSSAKSVVSTGVGKMQAWVAGQTTGRSLTQRPLRPGAARPRPPDGALLHDGRVLRRPWEKELRLRSPHDAGRHGHGERPAGARRGGGRFAKWRFVPRGGRLRQRRHLLDRRYPDRGNDGYWCASE